MSTTDTDRIAEIMRVFSCSKIDFFNIFYLPVTFIEDDIKSQYKKLSVLLHPDKAPLQQQERAKVAFSVLNAAKEGLDTPEKIAYWQNIAKQASDEVLATRSEELTKLKQQTAKDNGLTTWATLTVTKADVMKMEQYETWVRAKVKENVIADDWKKKQLQKRQQQEVNQMIQEEEAVVKRQQIVKEKGDDFEKDLTLRAQSWRGFQAKRGSKYIQLARSTRSVGTVEQAQTLTSHYRETEQKLSARLEPNQQ